MFKASARLNGVADAIKAGEKIAKMRVSRFSHWIVYTRLFPTADRHTRDSRCSDPTIGFVSQFYRPLLPGLRRVILYLVIQASATSSIYSIELSTNYGTFLSNAGHLTPSRRRVIGTVNLDGNTRVIRSQRITLFISLQQ